MQKLDMLGLELHQMKVNADLIFNLKLFIVNVKKLRRYQAQDIFLIGFLLINYPLKKPLNLVKLAFRMLIFTISSQCKHKKNKI